MALSKAAKLWLSEHGFVEKSGHFFGQLNGYLLTVAHQGYFLDYCVVRYPACDIRPLHQELAQARKQRRLKNATIQNKFCTVSFRHSGRDAAALEDGITALTQALAAAGVPDMSACCKCAKPASGPYTINLQAHSLCPDCAEKGMREGNPFFGLIGAILGAAVGMIPWIVVALMGYVSMWLAMLLAFCSFWGYRLLARGAADYTKWIVLPVSLFFSLLAYFVTLFIQIGEWVTPELLRAVVQVVMTEPDVIGELALVGIFSLVGVVVGAVLMHRSIMKPLPPLPPYASGTDTSAGL